MSRRRIPDNERFCQAPGCDKLAGPLYRWCREHYNQNKRDEARQKKAGLWMPKQERSTLTEAAISLRLDKAHLAKRITGGGDVCKLFNS